MKKSKLDLGALMAPEGLVFEEEYHQYHYEGSTVISATQLLKKHNLTPKFTGVPREVLDTTALKGTYVHELCQQIYENKSKDVITEVPPKLIETFGKAFAEAKPWEDFTDYKWELPVIEKNHLCAGRLDFIGRGHDGELWLCDLKSGNPDYLDLWSTAWQLELYKYMFEQNYNEEIRHIACWHFDYDSPGGKLEAKKEELTGMVYPDAFEEFLDAERDGRIYKGKKITIATERLREIEALAEWHARLVVAQENLELVQSKYDSIKRNVIETFEQNRIIRMNPSPAINMYYVKRFPRITIDGVRFRKEEPKLSKKYTKVNWIEPNLRISMKKEYSK